MRGSLAFFLLAWFGLVTSNEEGEEEVHFTNSWAVHFDNEDLHAVNDIAQKHGFVNQGQIGSLPGYYHFVKNTVGERSRRSLEDHSETLLKEPKVKWVEQQRILERSKRDVIPGEDELVQRSVARLRRDTAVTIRDPFFKDQWYLQNIGQSSGPRGIDINVLPVWARGFSGRGVVVSVLDDGVDHTHPDLEPNYDPDASFDFNEFDGDPKPRDDNLANCHGTKCAGEVAGRANNGICGVGVSFNASIGGIRMLDGKATDTVEGSSLSYRSDYIDIYSCCWGPKDDGKRFGKPGYLASKALQIGAERGRGGLGNIYVWATGNGGLTDDDCNCDGYTTSIYTISIGAISDHGLSTYYTETCASTLGVTFSGGSHRESEENKVVTTDLHHKCTGVFKGTSSAAPLAAGMMALLLEANPRLSWRDVQHIIVESSHVTSPLDEGWKINGAGKRYNHKFGFGRLDASRMVEKALKWKNVDRQKTCPGAEHNTTRLIPASGSLILSANTSACASTSSEIRKLEHVQLKVSLQHRHRGDLSISLISPSGTRSELLTTRRNDHSAMGLKDWVFMTVHCWGEDPRGLWTVIITDNDNNNRKHYADKAKQGDAEDVTRIFMDDTGKHRPVQTGDKDDSQMSPNGGLMQDHVMKTMEDTAGNLFKGNGFTKFVHRKKMHLVDTPSVPVTKKKPVLKKPVKSSVNHIVKDSKVTPLHKEYRKSGKDKKHKKLSKSHKLTSFSKQSSKRFAKKKDHKHADIVKLQHKRKAAKKRLTSGNITPKKIANPKHKKHKDPSKKVAKTKLKFHKTLKPNFNSSKISPVQPLRTSLHKLTVAGNVSTSSNATALGLITKLLSEIQKNPLVTKIAMEALKDPAIGRLFGVKPFGAVPEKALGALVSSSPRGNNSDSKSHLENNSSLVNTSNQTEKPEESKYLEGNIINGSKVESAFEGQHVGELESSGQPENQLHGSIEKISGSGKDDLTNKVLDVSGSGAEESGSYWETGSVQQMHSDESGSAESGETDSVENTREMGCAKGQCNETQTGGGISVIIQGTPANESSNEFGGEDSFVEVSDEDDRESLYGDGEGEEFFENVKKVVESEDGPVVLEPAVDRSRINSGNKNEDSLNLCDLMGGPQNRSAMARKYCKENGTLNSNTDGNDYENEQLAHYLALGKFKGSPTGSSEDQGMENQGEKSENEPYYSDKSDETRDTHDQMVAKYSSRDLEVLQEALEDQLSRLSKDPASQKSNAEILARVRDDINHGDIEDLELLEAQITGGKSTVPRVIRSTAPEDEDLDDLDDSSDAISDAMPDAFEHIDQTFEHNDQTFEHIDQEDDELERRRVEHRSEKHKLSQMYFVDPDKYGDDNSGILDSWTLVFYGTK